MAAVGINRTRTLKSFKTFPRPQFPPLEMVLTSHSPRWAAVKVNERTHRRGWLRAAVTVTHPGRHRARLRGARRSQRGQKARARAFGSQAWLRPTAPVRKGRAGLLAWFHLLALKGSVRAPKRHTQTSLPGTRPASPGQRPEHPDSCARRTNKERSHWLKCQPCQPIGVGPCSTGCLGGR